MAKSHVKMGDTLRPQEQLTASKMLDHSGKLAGDMISEIEIQKNSLKLLLGALIYFVSVQS